MADEIRWRDDRSERVDERKVTKTEGEKERLGEGKKWARDEGKQGVQSDAVWRVKRIKWSCRASACSSVCVCVCG